ncbi:hypothetical protein HMPREF3213_02330 [Heyndrickxia coagulans]|uniref:Uncharacterized protein n=1 Tax=Heyndrickxia coagulans TaxID=1398 RepID=A0A133KLD2_HEYCO|nr:hypothetical protein HMPREF3213_02330 [Heyndrickxia coagulans]
MQRARPIRIISGRGLFYSARISFERLRDSFFLSSEPSSGP